MNGDLKQRVIAVIQVNYALESVGRLRERLQNLVPLCLGR
jgi:hypothetical protein